LNGSGEVKDIRILKDKGTLQANHHEFSLESADSLLDFGFGHSLHSISFSAAQ
jgi:hypothetical protein